jgi:phage shock protein PspC (stress-responsive transcriptional regulator)
MGIGTVGVISALKSKRTIVCACLGGFFNLPMSYVTLFENLTMIAMAFIMLLFF